MDLKKLPPSMLVVLGLACARSQPTMHPCLSPPYDPSGGDEVGPCLSPPEDPGGTGTTGEPTEPTDPDPGDEPPMHPCLSPPPPDQAQGALGERVASPATEAGRAPAASRDDAIERVLARATLPSDVAERLRRRSEPE